MMRIMLMRHADALSRAAAGAKFDADRPLSTVGREQARLVGQLIAHYGTLPTPIVCSPFVRTQETAALVNEQLPAPAQILPLTILAPGSGSDELLRAMLNYADPANNWVLAVLHEPDVSCILGAWLYPDARYPFEVHPGDLFAVSLEIGHGKCAARLLASYSPSGMNQV